MLQGVGTNPYSCYSIIVPKELPMTYQQALIITRQFQQQHYRFTSRPTEAVLRQYGEACKVLKR